MGGGHLFDHPVEIEDNNIFLDGEEFKGTTGLWALIMENTPKMSRIKKEELLRYKRLMKKTNIFQIAQGNQGARRTRKYALLEDLMKEEGEGISFLPTDINSLLQRLNVLLAEFTAGNRATRNEIVAIVDNLVGRKKIKKDEVKEINDYLQNVDH